MPPTEFGSFAIMAWVGADWIILPRFFTADKPIQLL
jgi:hypothetical protein